MSTTRKRQQDKLDIRWTVKTELQITRLSQKPIDTHKFFVPCSANNNEILSDNHSEEQNLN